MTPALIPSSSVLDSFRQYGGYSVIEDPFARYGGRSAGLDPPDNHIHIQEKFLRLFRPARYKVAFGGRGGVKSWQFARALLILGLKYRLRILCGREFMTSIEDSVHKTLKDQIEMMGFRAWYDVGKREINGANGTTFRFVGLGDMTTMRNRARIKSYEAIDILWVEEAENISERTWETVIPTIRKSGSEIWITYNPNLATDATYQRFHPDAGHVPPGTVLIDTSWRDNLWMSNEMRWEKDHLFRVDAEAAGHVWDGKLRNYTAASIFADKCTVHEFDPPRWDSGHPIYHGLDFGMGGEDPTALVRFWLTGTQSAKDEEMWIDAEAVKPRLDINHTAAYFDSQIPALPGEPTKVSSARKWPIKADSSYPAMINYLVGEGFFVTAAQKWPGSVEDGIQHIRRFVKIHIHPRCKNMIFEKDWYKWKVDKNTGAILPVPVDLHNHGWDAVRYGLDGSILHGGGLAVWEALGRA
jgi:phage terminase large subunit